MPLYEYECPSCTKRLEEQFKIAEKPDMVDCPCGGKAESVVSLIMYGHMNDPTLRKEALMKRSADHSEKEMKHSYEKFGFKAYGGQKFPGMGAGKLGKKKAQNKKK